MNMKPLIAGLVAIAILANGYHWFFSRGPSIEKKTALLGKWQRVDSDDILEFTKGENLILLSRNQIVVVGRYHVTEPASLHLMQEGNRLRYRDQWAVYEMEFLSDDELLLVMKDDGVLVADALRELRGRWRRVSSGRTSLHATYR